MRAFRRTPEQLEEILSITLQQNAYLKNQICELSEQLQKSNCATNERAIHDLQLRLKDRTTAIAVAKRRIAVLEQQSQQQGDVVMQLENRLRQMQLALAHSRASYEEACATIVRLQDLTSHCHHQYQKATCQIEPSHDELKGMKTQLDAELSAMQAASVSSSGASSASGYSGYFWLPELTAVRKRSKSPHNRSQTLMSAPATTSDSKQSRVDQFAHNNV